MSRGVNRVCRRCGESGWTEAKRNPLIQIGVRHYVHEQCAGPGHEVASYRVVALKLAPEHVAELDRRARNHGGNRSETVRRWLES